MPCCAMALRSRFQYGMVMHGTGAAWAWVCVNETRAHCVNQMGKTQSKPLAARHGMCELAFRGKYYITHPALKQTQTQNMEDQHLKDPSSQYLGVRIVQQTFHEDLTPSCYAGLACPTNSHNRKAAICARFGALPANRPLGSSRRFGGSWGLRLCVYTYIYTYIHT
jgi:hypothetical protein